MGPGKMNDLFLSVDLYGDGNINCSFYEDFVYPDCQAKEDI